jgi:hypothetical protein
VQVDWSPCTLGFGGVGSPEVKTSVDRGLIQDHQVLVYEPPSGGFSFCARPPLL